MEGIFLPGFKPSNYNTVHLTGTAADAIRMGGTANNVYSTFQTAYDAAVVIQAATSQQVVLRVYNTTTTAGTTSVGNLTLTANYNSNVKIVGISPIFSVLGTITANNASGAGFTLTLFSENVRIGNCTTSSTGTTGNGGAVTLNITNCIFGNFTTSPTNASNTTGTGGNFVINQLAATTNNGYCLVGSITTSAITTAAVGAGSVKINVGSGLLVAVTGWVTTGPITTGIGSNTTGDIWLANCKVGNMNSITSSIATEHSFNNCKISGISSFSLANGARMCFSECTITNSGSFTIIASGDGSTQPVVEITNSRLGAVTGQNTQGALFNCDLKIKLYLTNSYVGLGSAANLNIGDNSKASNCYFSKKQGAFAIINGIGTGVEFYNCYFEHLLAQPSFTNATNVSVKLFNCKMNVRPTAFVALPAEEEFSETVSTTNATVTTIFTYPVPTGQKLKITFDVSGVDASGNVVTTKKYNLIKNAAGVLTKLSASDKDIVALFSDAPLAACAVTTTISGTNLLVQVTGIAATNITWTANIRTVTTF